MSQRQPRGSWGSALLCLAWLLSAFLVSCGGDGSTGNGPAAPGGSAGPAAAITGFSAARTIISAGSSTTLKPVFVNAASAAIDQGVGQVASGSGFTVAPAATTVYTLTVTGQGGPVTGTVTVTVVPPPAITSFSAAPQAVLSGGSSLLSAVFSGSGSIDHGIGPVTSGQPVGTGAMQTSTTYTLTVTNAASDTVTATTTVTTGPAAAITGFGAARSTITAGASTTLLPVFANAAGAAIDQGVGQVTSGSGVTVAPSATTVYTLTVTGLGGPVTRTVTVTVVPPPAISSFSSAPQTVLSGGSSLLTAVFAGSGSIDHGIGPVTSGQPVGTGAMQTSTTYTLTVSNAASDAVSASTTVTTGSAVAITAFSAARTTITAGASTTLLPVFVNAAGAAIDQGVGQISSGAAVTVSPQATTIYTLTASGLGGPVSRTVTITVVPPASIISFAAAPPAVASGGASQLTAVFAGGTGAIDHGIGPVGSGAPVTTGALAASTGYSLTVTNAAGDSLTASATVTVGPAVAITGLSAARPVISAGASTTLTPFFVNATGAGIDQGVGQVASGAAVTVAPQATTVYTLTAAGLGGPVTQSVTVTVVPPPSIASFSAAPAAVLTGGSSLLTGVFVGSGTIDQGIGAVSSGQAVTTGILQISASYTLTVTNAAGDSVTGAATVTAGPGVAITGFSATQAIISAGSSTTLRPLFVNAGNAAIDQGVGQVTSGSGFTVAPAATTVYTLTVSGLGGPVSRTVTVTVVPPPGITSFSAAPQTVLSGGASQLTAVFSGSGTIDHGVGAVTSGQPVSTGAVQASTTYTLTVTNAAADSVTGTATVTMGSAVAITAFTATKATISAGSSTTLLPVFVNASDAAVDHGVGQVASGSGHVVSPLVTTVYTLTANGLGGPVTLTVTVTVVPLPAITSFSAFPTSVNTNNSSQLTAVFSGGTATVDHNQGAFTSGVGVYTGPLAASTTFTLTVTNAAGDSVTATAAVTVKFYLTFLSGGNGQVNGTNLQNIPTGGSSTAVTAAPFAGYAFTGWTGTGGFVATLANPLVVANVAASQTITANFTALPAIGSFTAVSNTITQGQTAILNWSQVYPFVSASIDNGVGAIQSPNGSTSASPSTSTTYTLTTSNAAGTATASVTVTVLIPPVISAFTATPAAIQQGQSSTLAWTVTGNPTSLSINQQIGTVAGASTSVTPQATTTYTLIATNASGSRTASVTVTVLSPPPVLTLAGNTLAFASGIPITPVTPSNSGGAAASWSIAPQPPAGLSFSTQNGTLSGTPSATAALRTYVITATNNGGSATVNLSFEVDPPGPVITTQPHGLVLAQGSQAGFTVAASGTGVLSYQWCRNGTPIGGAVSAAYTLGAIAPADDRAVFTVIVTDGAGNSTTSDPAILSVLQDLAAWLGAHPAIANAIKWQTQSASANVYLPPTDANKLTWPNWSASQKSDLNQAYLNACAWFSQGAPQVTMTPGGPGLTDQPTNMYDTSHDSTSTMVDVTPAYMWNLYTAHVGFSLMLELSGQVPWSVTGYSADALKWLFDSATMAWFLPNGFYAMGTYGSAGLPALRTDNRPRTTFADPMWTYPWLKQALLVGASRPATIGNVLEWMRYNLTHFYGTAEDPNEDFGTDAAVWQYRGYSPLSKIIGGTVDSRYPALGMAHYTAGCHGSTGFLNAILRVLNIPVQPIWACGHEMDYFMSEDLYMDHGDDPYNAVVRASDPSLSILLLLINSTTFQSRFGNDLTVNLLDDNSPACAFIGQAAADFP